MPVLEQAIFLTLLIITFGITGIIGVVCKIGNVQNLQRAKIKGRQNVGTPFWSLLPLVRRSAAFYNFGINIDDQALITGIISFGA